jgi:hypothetical protein
MLKNSKSAEKSVLRGAKEVVAVEQYWHKAERPKVRKPPKNYKYTKELAHLQFELIKLQEWVRTQKLRVDYPNGNTVTIEQQIEPGVILTGDGERLGVGETIAFLINDGQMLDGTVDDKIAWRVLNPEILHKHDVVQP